MENVLNFLADYSTALHIIAAVGFVGIGVLIARSMPPKKPKSFGILHVIHYPNQFKELYLELDDAVENFEKNDQICFDIRNENVDAY